MQPVFVGDAAEAVLSAALRPAALSPATPPHRVVDLVGPEAVSYRDLVGRIVRVARAQGRHVEERLVELPVAEAERRARAGGFQGMGPDTLDCLLCDEVADPGPLQALLGRPLTPLQAALEAAVRAPA
jgi:uncharacterized protein YbjT (DUF2867 family)